MDYTYSYLSLHCLESNLESKPLESNPHEGRALVCLVHYCLPGPGTVSGLSRH